MRMRVRVMRARESSRRLYGHCCDCVSTVSRGTAARLKRVAGMSHEDRPSLGRIAATSVKHTGVSPSEVRIT